MPRLLRKLTGLMMGVVCLSGCRTEQDLSTRQPSPELMQFVSTPTHQAAEIRAAKTAGVWLSKPCGSANFTTSKVTDVLLPAKFELNGIVSDGFWQEQLAVEGYGRTLLLKNVNIAAPGLLIIGPLIQEYTHADALLQQDGYKTVRALSGSIIPGCADKTYIDNATYFGDEQQAGSPGASGRQPWKEQWKVVSCEKSSIFTLHFLPDGKGGTFIKVLPTETVTS